SAGMAAGALAPNWWLFLAAMLLTGLGFASVDVGLNAAIGDASETAGKRAVAMNLLHAAFPVGTLAAPALLSLLWQVGQNWRSSFLAIALASGISLLPLLLRRRRWRETDPLHTEGSAEHTGGHSVSPLRVGMGLGGEVSNILTLLREPALLRLSLLQGLYVGAEVALAGWITTYLLETFRADEPAAALATSVYWAGFLIGRPVIALITHRAGPYRLLPWLIGAGLGFAVLGVFATSALVATGAYFLTGLAICGVFPTVMALALEGRVRDAGSVAALITAAGGTGSLIWPWIVGVVADGQGLRVAMAVAAVPFIVMWLISLQVRAVQAR
ncbi:MAG TPA: MFS transporter, partial [Chloroflexota bacterium]|nr:MFS transporter [Chloroflexota bacterium]